MPLDPSRVEEVFTAALQQGSAEECAAFLETACAGDVALRDRVEALLRAHGEASHFLVRAAAEQFVAQPGSTEAVAARPVAPELTVTSAEQPGDDQENPLDFLQPSTEPGALGRLGHYEVLEVLGKGGFGIVLKAFDELLLRVVAIKVMSTQLAATSPARKRFLREARAAAKIRNENVVAIYDVEDQPIPYLVMEYIAGETLQQRLDRMGPLDTPEVLRLGQQIAAGLAAAHAMGLIHRDIKPSNILLENGVEQRVKLTDFGLARAADDASLTQSGFIAGTPMYMAPEQAEGAVIDQRADLFSLGSVLYVMCSGRPPFRASGTMAVLKRVTEDTPRPIREIIPEVPEWLCAIVAKLHAKNPAERFQSAKEVTDLLSQHLAYLQQPALTPPPASIFPAKVGPASRAGLDSAPQHRAPGSGSARRTYFGKRVLLNILIASLSFGALACILWAILWLTRDKEPPIAPPSVTTPVPPLAKAPFSAAEARQYQEAWAKHLGVEVEITNAVGMKLRLIPPGEFPSGTSPETLKQLVELAKLAKALPHELLRLANEGAVHPVRLTRPFYLGSYEVTYGQFRQFVRATNYVTDAERSGKGGWSNHQGQWSRRPEHVWKTPGEWEPLDDEPVVHITWNDAVAFCKWMSRLEGLDYVLPTEAQWECAARAGTTDDYPAGGYEQLSQYAWTQEGLGEPRTHHPHAGGQKEANAFGLYDMLGNVWECCSDWYADGPKVGLLLVDPTGPPTGVNHVLRGGAWYRSGPVFARYSARVSSEAEPGFADAGIGFRVAITGNLKEKRPSLAVAPFDAQQAKAHQEAWAKHLGASVETTNSAGMKMVLVPPGEFLMGMTDEEVAAALKGKAPGHWLYNNYRESRPQHKVTISKPFYMAATEVTVAQFRAFVTDTGYRTEAERDGKGGTRWDDKQKQLIQEKNLLWDTPGYGVSRNMPVTQLTWNDAVAYCNWLSKREALSRRYEETGESWDPVSGDGYSLPTEAQWEYACKAGTTTLYSCGTDEETLSKYAWYSKNSEGRPHPVGTKLANAFGLFDMHGNASEFCQDYYDPKYYKPREAIDPHGPDVGKAHVRRGGQWDADADAAPSALRESLEVHHRQRSTGFRVVRELPGVSGAKIENPEPPRAVAPFVLLTKDAQAERKFASLAEAVAAAMSGDTIEVQGNGPFVAAPLVLLEKRLTIRAGQGYHPVLTPSTETPKWQPFFDTNAPLVLEGLEFRINGQPFALPEKNAYRYAIRTRQPLYLANCRFVAKAGQFATIRSSGSTCQLLNCQFLGADLHGALDWESSNGGKVLLKNCQQAGSIFWFAWHDDSPELNNVTVQLTDNTVLAGPPLALMLGIVPGQVEAPFRMEVSRNILQAARQVFSLSVTNETAEKKVKGNKAAILKKLVRWQGQQNVYGNKTDFLFLGEGAPMSSLQDWKKFWGSAEEKSQRELPSFEGGDLLKLAATDPERMEANDFRLKAGSPGKGAGPGGKDIGADADLVGPGAAYEKWKQTPEYQEWRKKTDSLLGDR